MIDNGILVVSARPLTVFRERIQRLVDQFDVIFVDVVAQQAEKSCLRAADRIEELQRFTDKVVIGFVIVLQSEIVLIQWKEDVEAPSRERDTKASDLKFGIVILAEQLEKAQNRFHDANFKG